MIRAVIGANYGDEGKGLAVNSLAKEGTRKLVVRYNGGAQSGHTVDLDSNKRFVFHELGSGSFQGADTLWESTYHPDLYALHKEYESFYNEYDLFYSAAADDPNIHIYAMPDTKITIITDVILNWIKESNFKAGSCGMGIWECVVRNNSGFAITMNDLKQYKITYDPGDLFNKLKHIRDVYVTNRLKALKNLYDITNTDYVHLLFDDTILYNYAKSILSAIRYITIVSNPAELYARYDNIIFEGGQGLLLDGDYDPKYGTPSKTGLYNVSRILGKLGLTLDEAIYVTRPYLTRHGHKLYTSCDFGEVDMTNVYNHWQGGMNYAKFISGEPLVHRVYEDCTSNFPDLYPSILVTHAKDDGNILVYNEDNYNLESHVQSEASHKLNNLYISNTPFGIDKKI